jgi:pilus assembly protein CpaB
VAVKLNKNWLLLILAIVIGGVAFYLSYSAINSRIQQLDEEANKGKVFKSVVVASRDLQSGESINSANVSLRKIPQEFVNASSITGDNFESIDGQGLLLPVKAGEPILTSYTATRGGAYFSGTLKNGRRALTIEVDEISSISGMLRAGDNIDLLVTAKSAKPAGVVAAGVAGTEDLTFPLLSNVPVLATGQAQRGNGNAAITYTHVTLDVSPDEASSIIAAKNGGKMTAVLRSPTDQLPNSTRSKTLANVLPNTQASEQKMVEYLVGGSGGSGVGVVSQAPALMPVVETPKSTNISSLSPPTSTTTAVNSNALLPKTTGTASSIAMPPSKK